MMRIFIGYDDRQPVAYNVLQFSIISRASQPVTITPLVLGQLPIQRRGLTPFTYSRFLVPWLCGFEGTALFLDVDMLVLSDVAQLFDLAGASAVQVVKHKTRFEWPSVMLFNCAHADNRCLTPEYVETANNDALLGMGWTNAIGELPADWNHLVMYDPPKAAKLVHFTAGIPCFPETKELGYATEWMNELKAAMNARPWSVLMGSSVHAKPVLERLKAKPASSDAGKSR